MKTQRQSFTIIVAIAVGLLCVYLASRHFHWADGAISQKSASQDPFAPVADSLLARTFGVVASPIRRFEWVRERRAIGESGKVAMQGAWEGPVRVDRKWVELLVRVSAANIYFEKAPHWSELEGKTFHIEEDEGEWIPYFTTDLGRIYIQTPSELIDGGGSPDEMFLRTSGFLDPSEEDLKISRVKE